MLQQSGRCYAVGTCYSNHGFGYLKRRIKGFNNVASVHPETGDFQMLSDLASGSVRSDARQIHFSGALSNQISTN
jgi:hypothetical protein